MPITGRILGVGLLLAAAVSTVGQASGVGADGTAGSGPVLFGLALLVVAAKVGGLVVERWGQPAVLGELLAGVGLGNLLPLMFGAQGLAFVRDEPTLQVLAEIGVLILLFDVGLESDLRAFAPTLWSR